MTTTYIGDLTIGAALPGAALAASSGISGINSALPDILARLAALASFSPTPVSFVAQLSLGEAILSGINQSIALGLPVPSIAAQIAAVSALIADLLAQVVGINASLVIVQDFNSLLAAAGLHVFAFNGSVASLGSEVDAAIFSEGLSGGSGYALVLLTAVAGTWTAMSQIFRVTP